MGALLFAVLACACSRATAPGHTPRETAKQMEYALGRLDLASGYALLSDNARKDLARYCAALPGGRAKAPKDILADAGQRTRAANAKTFSSLQIAVGNVKDYGERCMVEGRLLFAGRATKISIPMVRAKGVWLIDAVDLLLRLPIQYVAPVACAAPGG